MSSSLRWARLAALLALLPNAAAQAGTLRGTVKNGTTGNPAPDVEVLLIQLQGGMETVAITKSGAQGAFTFDHPALGQQPMLVRAVYRGVNFHQPAPPGRDAVEIQVFEPTRDASILSFPTRFVVFQPNGSSLLVGEEYTVQNNSKPPQAYFRADGDFDFEIPDKAELQQVAAWGPSGMPVVQATIDRGKNKYAVAFAFHPGQNGVRLSYQIAYPGNQATVRLPVTQSVQRLIVLAPPGVDVRAEGLQASGTDQGMNVYVRDAIAAGQPFEVSVAGTAPPPSARGEQDAGQGGAPTDVAGNVQAIPGRLDVLKWPVIAGFAGLFALGAISLLRRPVPRATGSALAEAARPASVPKARKPAANAQPARPASAAIKEIDAAVGTSLDALKEALFRLELRRQAGTISEEEYARERARAEQVLRNLVRG